MLTLKSPTALGIIATVLVACGEGAMPFKEVVTGHYGIEVSEESTTGENPDPSSFVLEEKTGAAEDDTDYSSFIDDALSTDPADDVQLGETDDAKQGNNENASNSAHAKGKDGSSASAGNKGAETDGDQAQAGSDTSDVSQEDQQLLSICSKIFAGKAKRLKILAPDGSADGLSVDSNTVVAARLSGNQQNLALEFKGIARLAGICIVATGNQPSIDLISDVDLGMFAYIVKGNQSSGHVSLLNGHVIESSYIELKGHNHSLLMEGAAAEHCENVRISGNSSTATCQ